MLNDATGLKKIYLAAGYTCLLYTSVTVTLTLDTNIGLFGEFASFPITLRAKASGKSEVYWK